MIVLYPQSDGDSGQPERLLGLVGLRRRQRPGKKRRPDGGHQTMTDRVVSGNASAPYTCGHWYDSNYAHVYYGHAYVAATARRMRSIRTSILGIIRPRLTRMCGGRRRGSMLTGCV
jgi:hypothetical protein